MRQPLVLAVCALLSLTLAFDLYALGCAVAGGALALAGFAFALVAAIAADADESR